MEPHAFTQFKDSAVESLPQLDQEKRALPPGGREKKSQSPDEMPRLTPIDPIKSVERDPSTEMVEMVSTLSVSNDDKDFQNLISFIYCKNDCFYLNHVYIENVQYLQVLCLDAIYMVLIHVSESLSFIIYLEYAGLSQTCLLFT